MDLDTLSIVAELNIMFDNMRDLMPTPEDYNNIMNSILEIFNSLVFDLSQSDVYLELIGPAYDYVRDEHCTLGEKIKCCVHLKANLENGNFLCEGELLTNAKASVKEIIRLLKTHDYFVKIYEKSQYKFVQSINALGPLEMYNFLSCKILDIRTNRYLNESLDIRNYTIIRVSGPDVLNTMRYEFVIMDNTCGSNLTVSFCLNSMMAGISMCFDREPPK